MPALAGIAKSSGPFVVEEAALRRALAAAPANAEIARSLWWALAHQEKPIPPYVEALAAKFAEERARANPGSLPSAGSAAPGGDLIADAEMRGTLNLAIAKNAFADDPGRQRAEAHFHRVLRSSLPPQTREAMFRLASVHWPSTSDLSLQLLASSLFDRGASSDAIASLEARLDKVLESEPLTALYARYLVEAGRPVPAEIEELSLRRALAADPDNGKLVTALWGAILRQGKPMPPDVEVRAAKFAYEHAKGADTSNAEAVADLAAIAAAAQRYLIADAVVSGKLDAELARAAFAGLVSEQEAYRFVHAVIASPAKAETREAIYRLAGHMWQPASEITLQLLVSSLYDRGEIGQALAILESRMDTVRSVERFTSLYLRYLTETGKPVPAELEELSWRRALEASPDDGRAATALWGVLHRQGKPIPPELELLAAKAAYDETRKAASAAEAAVRTPGDAPLVTVRRDLASAARRYLLENAAADGTVDPGVLDAAFAYYPGETELHSYFHRLMASSCASEIKERILQGAVDRWPHSDVALHLLAASAFERGDVARALAALVSRIELVRRVDGLAEIYMKCLVAIGRPEEGRSFIRTFFESYTGDLWRTPDFAKLQAAACARGLPSILIATQPKSGSLFILNTLQRGLSIPTTYLGALTLQQKSSEILPQRLADFSRGGALALDHLIPDQPTFDALAACGVTRFVVHLRDPRQVALSWLHQLVHDENTAVPSTQRAELRETLVKKSEFEEMYLDYLGQWAHYQQTWFEGIESEKHRFRILVTDFDDLKTERAFFERLLDFFGIDRASFDMSVLASDIRERAVHFRVGHRREWEEVLSPETLLAIPAILGKSPLAKAYASSKDPPIAA